MMHYRTLVVVDAIDKKDAKSQIADYMRYVYARGRSTKAAFHWPDWHVIGGRWSGYLSNLVYWPNEVEFTKMLDDLYTKFWNKEAANLYAKERFSHLPEYLRFDRDEYKADGYEDDIQPLTPLFQSKLEELSKIPLHKYEEPKVVYLRGRGATRKLPSYQPPKNKTRFVVVLDVHS